MSGTPADRNKLWWGLFNLLSLKNWKDCEASPCEDKERLARIDWRQPSMLGHHLQPKSSHSESVGFARGSASVSSPRNYRARLKRLPFCARRQLPSAVLCGPSLNTSSGLWELCENSQLKCEKLYLKFLHNNTTFIFELIGSHLLRSQQRSYKLQQTCAAAL